MLNKVALRINQTANALGVPFLGLMMLLTSVDVIMRYIFDRPIFGAFELTEYMMSVFILLGLGYTAIKKGHVAVDVLVSRFKPGTQAVIDSITNLISIGIFCLIAWQSVVYGIFLKEEGQETSILGLPIFPLALLAGLGFLLLLTVLSSDFFNFLVQGATQSQTVFFRLLPAGIIFFILILTVVGIENIPEISPFIAGVLGFVLLFILMLLRMPVGFALAAVGFLGVAYLRNVEAAYVFLGAEPFGTAHNYSFSVIPLFVLMGFITFYSGMSEELYGVAYKWVGSLPGGLAMATVVACGLFAAICGTSTAGAATMGAIALPEMEKYKYDIKLATGCIAAGGTVGVLIPPSVMFLLYALLTDQSVGMLFVAGILPGIMSVILYMAVIYGVVRINPKMGPRGPASRFIEKLASLKSIWAVLILFVLVIAGIYGGIFTPTEGGGIGAFGAFIIGLARRRLSLQNFRQALHESARVTTMIFMILIGAHIFGSFLAMSQLPFVMADFISGLSLPPMAILVAILITWLILGALMPGIPMVILTVPIYFPIILAMGFDPIWFGVLMVMMLEIACITPPMGINVFVLSGVARHVPMGTIFEGILPFLATDLIRVALVIIFPIIALWLPNLLK